MIFKRVHVTQFYSSPFMEGRVLDFFIAILHGVNITYVHFGFITSRCCVPFSGAFRETVFLYRFLENEFSGPSWSEISADFYYTYCKYCNRESWKFFILEVGGNFPAVFLCIIFVFCSHEISIIGQLSTSFFLLSMIQLC